MLKKKEGKQDKLAIEKSRHEKKVVTTSVTTFFFVGQLGLEPRTSRL